MPRAPRPSYGSRPDPQLRITALTHLTLRLLMYSLASSFGARTKRGKRRHCTSRTAGIRALVPLYLVSRQCHRGIKCARLACTHLPQYLRASSPRMHSYLGRPYCAVSGMALLRSVLAKCRPDRRNGKRPWPRKAAAEKTACPPPPASTLPVAQSTDLRPRHIYSF